MEKLSHYLEEAKVSLIEMSIVQFIQNMTRAEDLLVEFPDQYEEVYYTYVKGLYEFQEYEQGVKLVQEILPQVKGNLKDYLLIYQGIMFGNLGQFTKAIEIFEQLATEGRDEVVRLKALNNLAWVYIYLFKLKEDEGYLKSAEEKCQLGLDGCQECIGEKIRLMDNLGTIYWYAEKYTDALNTYDEALKIAPDDPKLLNNIAATHVQLGNINQALHYLKKSENIAEKISNVFEKAQAYEILAELFEYKEDYAMAIDYYQIALDIFVSVEANIEAYECFDNILRLKEKTNRETIKIFRNNLKGNTLRDFGMKIKLDLDIK